MNVRWRCAISMSLAAVGLGALCSSASAAPACDSAAVKRALARTATAINTQRPQLLAQTYEPFPTAPGAVARSPYSLRISRPVGKPKQNRQVAELTYAPGAKSATFLRALGRVSQLGHWSVGDKISVGHGRRLVGITAEFFVARDGAALRYYGKGGFDCKTGRIFILAPLRQRSGS
jgi:hypothetical protein